jgi:CDP-glucose 4,6-dehydratase
MQLFDNFYKNKKILVTGDTGFKGSWLCLWLNMLGAQVLGYALPPENETDHYNIINLNTRIKHIDGDIRDYEKFKKTCLNFNPDIIFHLAAQPLVIRGYKESKYTFETNVIGSVNLLEIAKKLKNLKSLVYITSDKCYKNKEWIFGYRENDELGGHDPYSASKAAAEIVFASYYSSFFEEQQNIGLASVRAGNVIGGGDFSSNRLIPDCIKALINKESILIRKPNAIRPWQHVLEPIYGYLLLGFKLYKNPKKYSSSWNFGPDSKSLCDVKTVAEKVIKEWGKGKLEIAKNKPAVHETGLLNLNCDKAHNLLKWYPKWDIKQTIFETIEWYKNFAQKNDMLQISKKQIEKYMETL